MAEWTERMIAHCAASESANPTEIALEMMDWEGFPVAGQPHHPLIAGALMTAYQNASGRCDRAAIEHAIKRADTLPAGFCAGFGADAGAIAAGVVLSVLHGNTIKAEYSHTRAQAHQMTAQCLLAISTNTGNRCCKRTVFQVLETAAAFMQANLDVKLERPLAARMRCPYASGNSLCNHDGCRYYLPDA